MDQILKYPRTKHIETSKWQTGDVRDYIAMSELKTKNLVIEEKMDGSNSGISFINGKLMLQSRGHYLLGHPRELHFSYFKQWANQHMIQLKELLGERYIMYGEYLFAIHCIFYDQLPAFFMEFDIYDKEERVFLSTERRQKMLEGVEFIKSVKVLGTGKFDSLKELLSLFGKSNFISENPQKVFSEKYPNNSSIHELDFKGEMEGLYIKWEDENKVLGNYKWVRASFIQTVLKSNHWVEKKMIKNLLNE